MQTSEQQYTTVPNQPPQQQQGDQNKLVVFIEYEQIKQKIKLKKTCKVKKLVDNAKQLFLTKFKCEELQNQELELRDRNDQTFEQNLEVGQHISTQETLYLRVKNKANNNTTATNVQQNTITVPPQQQQQIQDPQQQQLLLQKQQQNQIQNAKLLLQQQQQQKSKQNGNQNQNSNVIILDLEDTQQQQLQQNQPLQQLQQQQDRQSTLEEQKRKLEVNISKQKEEENIIKKQQLATGLVYVYITSFQQLQSVNTNYVGYLHNKIVSNDSFFDTQYLSTQYLVPRNTLVNTFLEDFSKSINLERKYCSYWRVQFQQEQEHFTKFQSNIQKNENEFSFNDVLKEDEPSIQLVLLPVSNQIELNIKKIILNNSQDTEQQQNGKQKENNSNNIGGDDSKMAEEEENNDISTNNENKIDTQKENQQNNGVDAEKKDENNNNKIQVENDENISKKISKQNSVTSNVKKPSEQENQAIQQQQDFILKFGALSQENIKTLQLESIYQQYNDFKDQNMLIIVKFFGNKDQKNLHFHSYHFVSREQSYKSFLNSFEIQLEQQQQNNNNKNDGESNETQKIDFSNVKLYSEHNYKISQIQNLDSQIYQSQNELDSSILIFDFNNNNNEIQTCFEPQKSIECLFESVNNFAFIKFYNLSTEKCIVGIVNLSTNYRQLREFIAWQLYERDFMTEDVDIYVNDGSDCNDCNSFNLAHIIKTDSIVSYTLKTAINQKYKEAYVRRNEKYTEKQNNLIKNNQQQQQ